MRIFAPSRLCVSSAVRRNALRYPALRLTLVSTILQIATLLVETRVGHGEAVSGEVSFAPAATSGPRARGEGIAFIRAARSICAALKRPNSKREDAKMPTLRAFAPLRFESWDGGIRFLFRPLNRICSVGFHPDGGPESGWRIGAWCKKYFTNDAFGSSNVLQLIRFIMISAMARILLVVGRNVPMPSERSHHT